MATLVATRHNPVIQAHYHHLLDHGKRKKVALVACMRKLLCMLNAILREQKPWRIHPATT
jgi:transposase